MYMTRKDTTRRKTILQILIIFSIKYCESGKWKVERTNCIGLIGFFFFEIDLIVGDEKDNRSVHVDSRTNISEFYHSIINAYEIIGKLCPSAWG